MESIKTVAISLGLAVLLAGYLRYLEGKAALQTATCSLASSWRHCGTFNTINIFSDLARGTVTHCPGRMITIWFLCGTSFHIAAAMGMGVTLTE